MFRQAVPFLVLGLAGVAGRSARADVVVHVGNKQRFDGTAVAGETIRISFPVAKGCKPKIRMTLSGAKPNAPFSFNVTDLMGPDGKEVAVDSRRFRQAHSTGRDTLTFSGWTAEASGTHELVVRTNAKIDSDVLGRIDVSRPRSVPFRGDAASRSVVVALQPGDMSSVQVQRVNGTAPRVERYVTPAGAPGFTPQQSLKSKKSTTYGIFADAFGDHEYRIGYQDDTAPSGAFRGKVRVDPFRGYGTVAMQLVNNPGVPLTVRNQDRYLSVDWGASGAGVSSAGDGFVLVTSESGGQVLGQRYTLDLDPIFNPLPEFSPVPLADAADLAPGETIQGHRVLGVGQYHFLAISSASGQSLVLKKLNQNRTVNLSARVVEASASSTLDFFLAADDYSVSVGRFLPPDGHLVHLFDATTLLPVGAAVPIGGPSRPHLNAAGAGWNSTDGVFELWAPTSSSTDPGADGDLRHLVFDANWAPLSAGETPVANVGVNEITPTAVSVDADTGATIVHYVVPEVPYPEGAIHRRVFDAAGIEIPGSHAILPGARRSRPTSLLLGGSLFLASDNLDGPTVERYRVLR